MNDLDLVVAVVAAASTRLASRLIRLMAAIPLLRFLLLFFSLLIGALVDICKLDWRYENF